MHLDEDALSAFVEGRLSERESAPLIQHLVACSYCRQATVQLVRLDSETVAPQIMTTEAEQEEPGRIRRLLDDLASRVLPSHDEETVFAYHAPAEDFKPRDEASGGTEQVASGEEDGSTPQA
jgi:hypothetical protein